MHIGLLTPSFPPMVDGGVAIATGRLVQSLAARGHRLTVVTTAPPVPVVSGTPLPVLVAQPHVSLHYGLVEHPREDTTAVMGLSTWMQARHADTPFDVLLAYFIYPAGYLAALLGRLLGVPVVCSCRGNDVSKDLFIAPETLATVLRRSTRLIFVSSSLLQMADTLVPCRPKATVVANAVDSAVFAPAEPGVAGKAPHPVVVGTSGVIRWKKGVDLLLPLIGKLCTTHDVRILIAGYALDTASEQQIGAFLRQHELQPRVEITGPLPHAQMVRVLRRMHLYVSTSYQEGMPNGVLEAMACALPVVATDADGTLELVHDGVTGYLCPMGDFERLVERCCRLIEQPALRQRMGQAGRRRVQQQFDPEQEARAVEAVLRQACGT